MKSYRNFLIPKERSRLLILHQAENSFRYTYKIKVILFLNESLTFEKIPEFLFLDDQTARNYLERFESGGTDAFLNDIYIGYTGKLRDKQKRILDNL